MGQTSAHSEGGSRPSLSPLDLAQQEASSARPLKPSQVRPLLHAARCKLHRTAGVLRLHSHGGI